MTDFDAPVTRRGTGSYKWDSEARQDVIPLWVADMDFPTAPAIIDALERRVKHGVFGYTLVTDAYYDALAGWYAERYGVSGVERPRVIYTSGVVPAISASIKALTHPGDGVIVMTPVYNCFFSSIRNSGCREVDVPLLRVELADRRFTYEIDFETLRAAAAERRNKVLLMCNPHNPAGRAWTPEELRRVWEICRETDTLLLSDEIHGDLAMPGYRFTPVMALGEDVARGSITFSSPSKAFNTAGLQIANIITASSDLRYAVDRAINDNEVCDVNPFGVEALIAAYTRGTEWLDGLIGYIAGNAGYASRRLLDELPWVSVARLEATYLLWVDISALGIDSEELEEILRERHGVWVNAGDMYGADGYIRINLATRRELLDEGLSRLIAGLRDLRQS